MVVNHAITTLRRKPKSEAVEFQEYHASSGDDSVQVGMAMDLDSALASLGEEDRAVVWLHDVEGYNHREIAGLFGKTESFSKTRLSRARKPSEGPAGQGTGHFEAPHSIGAVNDRMRYSKVHIMEKERDPLNLRGLPLVSPPQDDWPVIQAALLQQSKRRRVARLAASICWRSRLPLRWL